MTRDRVDFFFRIASFVLISRILYRIHLLPTWFHRTDAQQAALYAIGRTVDLAKKPVTNCDGAIKISKHQLWLAIDFVIVEEKKLIWGFTADYKKLGRLASKIGLRWGGDWDSDGLSEPNETDIYHFEYKGKA